MELFADFITITIELSPANTTIVISCYKRPTEWADRLVALGFDVHRYTKEDPTSPYNVKRNVGAEASAYLKYCMDSYETLSEYTIFLHNEEFSWHHEGSIIDRICDSIGFTCRYKTLNNSHNLPWFYWDNNDTSNVRKFYDDHIAEYLGPIERYGEFIGHKRIGAAQMIVHKDVILARPYELYFRIYQRFMSMADVPGAAKETGILMEYFWGIIFGDVPPIDWDAIRRDSAIAVICPVVFSYRANYCHQGIDFFLGTSLPISMTPYKWLIQLSEPLEDGFNFDMFYTRFLEVLQEYNPQETFRFDGLLIIRNKAI